ncbi:Asp-tRNA(Asn)/Glu-tRNA(Gln) amidotransferase subunit GatA [archaeon]|jgi:aspartyl-tRNA(Asn)/glutamyl-tRNA(Gln) amidotransferase subunit A|nr:Asp-tRNA(Asn)/Glu-tRNA(Gln) amidotransferase subunit GatA [archaeon]MBT4373809.1 Asp-tRNA(Asn)/Glu-tRNA(Gln) amidotransferase subunit GatA [archaeon]MBT4532275.1 Asp-tRNA(Asn)/Glu-tRNA(Gln) amidotransferase subunit GatA [archaeon]MBT7001100.1 Asp-tRNA(Asn)/Glu-tRNA(Gln) amidotransferase subunit GatA [archaeon]MBT7281989.1 Asp-tRNA(Asn)/Glu-tRNA(Gln) amidotransferase subunit GatA [archaeon]
MKKTIEQIKKENKKINAILEFNSDFKKNKLGRKGKLVGKVIGVKANICVEGLHASCASKVLENYRAPYDADVISKVKKEGGVILGMCNMDEFASGNSGETSAFGPTQNPTIAGYIPGGSSSGPAACVAAEFCDLAVGSDTGGSIRNPASFCGMVGLKPSYGAVSRYGLIDLAMSADTIGPIAKTVEDCALLYSVIYGRDEKDAISQKTQFNLDKIKKVPKKIVVGILDLSELKVDKKIVELVENKIKKSCEEYRWEIKKMKIPHLDLAVETYYPIVYVEAFSGTCKLDGRRFGKKVEDAAGPEFLRRVLGGKEITKAEHSGRYYNKAMQVKNFIEKEFEKVFEKFDCVVCPTVPRLPWKIGENISIEENYAADALTIPSSLAGNCAISIPSGEINKIPVGMQIICDKFQEEKLLQIANAVEKTKCKNLK